MLDRTFGRAGGREVLALSLFAFAEVDPESLFAAVVESAALVLDASADVIGKLKIFVTPVVALSLGLLALGL